MEKYDIPEENSLDSMEGLMEDTKIKLDNLIEEEQAQRPEQIVSERVIPEYEIKGNLSSFEEDKVMSISEISNINLVELFPACPYKGSDKAASSIHEHLRRISGKGKSTILGIETINFLLKNAPNEWQDKNILIWTIFRNEKGFPVIKYIHYDKENEIWIVKNLVLSGNGYVTPNLPMDSNGSGIWADDNFMIPFVNKD